MDSTERRLIPSKDAIRALRSLAFSSPIAFAGVAAAGACCLAHCGTRQRVRLATKRVGTKRTICSVAEGKHKQRAANTIETGDKGKIHLVGRNSAGERCGRRNHSSLATAFVDDSCEDSSENPSNMTDLPRSSHEPAEPSLDGTDLQQDPVGQDTVYSGSKDLPTAVWRRIADAKTLSHTLHDPIKLPKEVRLASRKELELLPLTAWDPGGNTVLDSPIKRTILSRAIESDASTIYRPQFRDDHSQGVEEKTLEQTYSRVLSRDMLSSPGELDTLLAQTSRRGLSIKKLRKLAAQEPGFSASLRDKLLQIAIVLGESNTGESLTKSLELVNGIGCCLSRQDEVLVRHTVFEKFIKQEEPHARALKLLERLPIEYARNFSNVQQWGRLFLEDYCEIRADQHSYSERLNMTQRVIEAYGQIGQQPQALLTLPLIRNLVKAGRVREAEHTYNELCELYKLDLDFVIIAVLIQGYAQQRNWSRVDYILSWLHGEGVSRREPAGFSGLVAQALREFAKVSPPEQTYDFLSYYIHTAGLIPTASVSSVAITSLVRSKRFDLLTRWLTEQHALFPARFRSAQTDDLDLAIAGLWEDSSFTCVDILRTCQTLGSVPLREPFSNMFRAVTSNALITRIDEHKRLMLSEFDIFRDTSIGVPSSRSSVPDFDVYIREAEQMSSRIYELSMTLSTRQQLMARNFYKQHQAAKVIHGFLRIGHYLQIEAAHQAHTPSESKPSVSSTKTNTGSTQLLQDPGRNSGKFVSQIPLPAGLSSAVLPSPTEIQLLVNHFYQSHLTAGLAPPHTELSKLAIRLQEANRTVEAVKMLSAIHATPEFTSPAHPFPLPLLTTWLHLATLVETYYHCAAAMWAILDSPSCKVSSRIQLLFRIAKRKTVGNPGHITTLTKAVTEDQVQEMNYLKHRLKYRLWVQHGHDPRQRIGKKQAG